MTIMQGDADEAAKLIPANIREGITVLGVAGSMSGSEGVKPQAKTVTPTFTQQTVLCLRLLSPIQITPREARR